METSIAEDLFTQTIDKEDRSVQESDKIVITDQLGRATIQILIDHPRGWLQQSCHSLISSTL